MIKTVLFLLLIFLPQFNSVMDFKYEDWPTGNFRNPKDRDDDYFGSKNKYITDDVVATKVYRNRKPLNNQLFQPTFLFVLMANARPAACSRGRHRGLAAAALIL